MLRDYQIDLSKKGKIILEEHGIVYFAMEVRTGKSRTALNTAELMAAKHVLCVTKKNAISGIKSEYEALGPSFLLDVFNFEALHQVVKSYDLIIIDEAHTCGGFPSIPERVKQLRDICKGRPVILLSGTPTPESYSQLYHQLSISNHSPWKEHKSFHAWVRAGYVTPKTKYAYNREFKDYSDADMQRIVQETCHLMLTYSQEEAGFEQPVQEHIIMVDMKPSTYTLAKILIKKRVFLGKNGEKVIADTAVKVQQKCHQIFSGTVLCEDKTAIAFDDSKVAVIKEKFAGKKIAIYYKFVAEGMMLKAAFAGRWTDDPALFNSSPDLCFISQIVSGREGVNLSTADNLIMFNIDFSALSYWQVRARLQTKDRTRPVCVTWLFSVGGIEEKIYKVVQDKKDYTLSHFKRDFHGEERVRHPGKDKGVSEKTRVAGT